MQPTEFEKSGIIIVVNGYDDEPCRYDSWDELYELWDGEPKKFLVGIDLTHINGKMRYIWRDDVIERFEEIDREVEDEKANYPGNN